MRKGNHHSEETKQKIRNYNRLGICGMLGRKHSEMTKEIMSKAAKHKKSELHKIACSERMKRDWESGKYKGHVMTEEGKSKISKSLRGRFMGMESPFWKGGYENHLWHARQRRVKKIKAFGFHTLNE